MYVPTKRQQEAWKLLREGPTHVMLVGGSRSGKTLLSVMELFCTAAQFPKSRQLMARLRFSHAKTSLWLDTIPKLMELEGLQREQVKFNETDHYIKFPNGSEIWVDGLDDKERVDKILGREYVKIFFNEISQISHNTVTTLLTRLAQNIPGCANKAYYDLNPVGRGHWAYKRFVLGIDPETGEEMDEEEWKKNYAYMTLNPIDNKDNLPSNYITDVLDKLPEDKRKRFLLGEWCDPEGIIFDNWDIIDNELPGDIIRHCKKSLGLDFGFTVHPAAFVWTGLLGEDLYVDELLYETGLTNQQLGEKILKLHPQEVIYGDCAEPKSIRELQLMNINIRGCSKGRDSIRQGVDWLRSKRIHVTRRSTNLQSELMNYSWKENNDERILPQPIDDYNHAIDGVRYATEPFRLDFKAEMLFK